MKRIFFIIGLRVALWMKKKRISVYIHRGNIYISFDKMIKAFS